MRAHHRLPSRLLQWGRDLTVAEERRLEALEEEFRAVGDASCWVAPGAPVSRSEWYAIIIRLFRIEEAR